MADDVKLQKTIQITGVKQVDGGINIQLVINGVAGTGKTFASAADLRQQLRDYEISDDDLLFLVLRIWYARDDTMKLANIAGKTLTLNYSGQVPLSVA